MAEAARGWFDARGNVPQEIAGVIGTEELIAAHFKYPTIVWGGGRSMTNIMAFVPTPQFVEPRLVQRYARAFCGATQLLQAALT